MNQEERRQRRQKDTKSAVIVCVIKKEISLRCGLMHRIYNIRYCPDIIRAG